MSHSPNKYLISHADAFARLFVFGLVAIIYVAILVMNSGKLTYTLDDAYIHLSVSEEIWRGNYGVNPGEISAPDSSIIFPFLLTLGAFWQPLHEYLPFVLNLVSVFLTMEILRVFLLRIGFGQDSGSAAIAATFVALAAVCLNMVCLLYTGMEQNLHIALTAVTVLGLVIFLEEKRTSWWFVVSAALLPTVRYEGLGLWLGVTVCLVCRGHWRAAIGVAAFAMTAVVGFSAFLVSHGLPYLPSSVLAKSTTVSSAVDAKGGGLLYVVQQTVSENLSTAAGIVTAGCAVIALAYLWTGWRRRSLGNETLVAFVLLVFAGGQNVVGHYGWMGRYEIYAIVGSVMMALYLVRASIADALAMPDTRARLAVCGIFALLSVGYPYIRLTAQSPVLANNMYEQQYRTHLFIVDYAKQPVAVADLGYPSYSNDYYVFDMLGLASEEARSAKNDLQILDRMIKARGIRIAIFYQNWWLKNQPSTWRCIGSLHLSRPTRAAMDICATAPEYESELRVLLEAFQRSLPSRIKLEIKPPSHV